MNARFMEMKIGPIKKICGNATDFLKSSRHSERNPHVNQQACEWVKCSKWRILKGQREDLWRKNYTFYIIFTVRFIGPAKLADKSYRVNRPYEFRFYVAKQLQISLLKRHLKDSQPGNCNFCYLKRSPSSF